VSGTKYCRGGYAAPGRGWARRNCYANCPVCGKRVQVGQGGRLRAHEAAPAKAAPAAAARPHTYPHFLDTQMGRIIEARRCVYCGWEGGTDVRSCPGCPRGDEGLVDGLALAPPER
jgi:hypothetical protein